MSFLRPALGADQEDLDGFLCARTDSAFEIEVQEFAQELLTWAVGDAHREALVLEVDGSIVGFVAYEDDDGDVFINALGIRADRQGEGLGKMLLLSVLVDLSTSHPGRLATWLVHPANFASHAVSEHVGAVATYPSEDQPYARYAIQL